MIYLLISLLYVGIISHVKISRTTHTYYTQTLSFFFAKRAHLPNDNLVNLFPNYTTRQAFLQHPEERGGGVVGGLGGTLLIILLN